MRAFRTGGAFGLALALGLAACFGAALAFASGVRAVLADFGLAAVLADFGLDAGRLAVLALAAGFTDFVRAVALPVDLAARGLARDEGFLLLLFAMSPCFRHYRPNAGRYAPRRSSNATSHNPVPPERARPRG